MSKIEIRQVEGEKIFTEICIDGHKIDGVRGYELKQDKAGFPVLTIDLNAFDIATDLRTLQLNQKYVGTIKSIKRKYIDDVHEFIDCYVVPKYLDELIHDANAQQSFA